MAWHNDRLEGLAAAAWLGVYVGGVKEEGLQWGAVQHAMLLGAWGGKRPGKLSG